MFAKDVGRFTTSDPSAKSINYLRPQSWNRYVYCLNNTLNLVDENGKWPTETHALFINLAFKGLSTAERGAMMLGSNSVDTLFATGGVIDVPITLIISEAYKHAMTPAGMTNEDAIDGADSWIEDGLNEALMNGKNGNV